MAKGWMSKDPSEMTARQQRRMQYVEKRGGGRVQGQPTEMPEMTARQQRRQQFLERKQARQDRRVEDWRAQQQGANMGNNFAEWAKQPFNENMLGRLDVPASQVQDGLGRFGPGVPYPLDLGGMGDKFGQFRPGTNPEMFQQPIFNMGPMNTLYNPIGESLGNFAGNTPFNNQAPQPQQPTYMDPRFAEANQRQMRGWGARYMNSQYPGANGGFAMPPRPGQG